VVNLSRLAQGSRADSTNGLYVGDIPQTQKLRPQIRGVSPILIAQPDRHKLTVLPVPGTGSSGYGSRGRPGRSSGFAPRCAGCRYRRSRKSLAGTGV